MNAVMSFQGDPVFRETFRLGFNVNVDGVFNGWGYGLEKSPSDTSPTFRSCLQKGRFGYLLCVFCFLKLNLMLLLVLESFIMLKQ